MFRNALWTVHQWCESYHPQAPFLPFHLPDPVLPPQVKQKTKHKSMCFKYSNTNRTLKCLKYPVTVLIGIVLLYHLFVVLFVCNKSKYCNSEHNNICIPLLQRLHSIQICFAFQLYRCFQDLLCISILIKKQIQDASKAVWNEMFLSYFFISSSINYACLSLLWD